MPSIAINLLFSGLVAYSPNANGSTLDVLVLNAVNSDSVPHQAFLSIGTTGAIKYSDFSFADDPYGTPGSKRTFIGAGYEMVITPSHLAGLSYKPCSILEPSDGIAATSVCLLVASNLWDQGYSTNLASREGYGVSIANDVALRLRLNAGKFGVLDQSPNGAGFLTGREMSWQTATGVTVSQYVPEVMIWESPLMSASEVVLTFRPLDGGAVRTIKVEATSGKPIEMRISNEPDILEYCTGAHKYEAHHLEEMARFSTQKPTVVRRPELVKQVDRGEIDKTCEGLCKAAGRQPVICYGVVMGQ